MAYSYGDQVDFTTHEVGWSPGYGYGDQVDFTTHKSDWIPGYGYGNQVDFTTHRSDINYLHMIYIEDIDNSEWDDDPVIGTDFQDVFAFLFSHQFILKAIEKAVISLKEEDAKHV